MIQMGAAVVYQKADPSKIDTANFTVQIFLNVFTVSPVFQAELTAKRPHRVARDSTFPDFA